MRRIATLLFVLVVTACAHDPRTRTFSGDAAGARAAGELILAQPAGWSASYRLRLAAESAPAPSVRFVSVSGGGLNVRRTLCAWQGRPPECAAQDFLLGVVLLSHGDRPRITRFPAEEAGIEAARAAASGEPGGVVLAMIPWRPVLPEEMSLSTVWTPADWGLVHAPDMLCSVSSWRCYASADVEALALVSMDGATISIVNPGADLSRTIASLGEGYLFMQTAERGVHPREATVSEVISIDDSEICGRVYESPFWAPRERCISFSEIEAVLVDDMSRVPGEMVLDAALVPFRFLGAVAAATVAAGGSGQ